MGKSWKMTSRGLFRVAVYISLGKSARRGHYLVEGAL
jgi:hypothetical protein